LLDYLEQVINRFSFDKITPVVARAFDLATESKLDSAPTLANILRWWHTSGLPLPAPVVRGWMRWSLWDSYESGEEPVVDSKITPAPEDTDVSEVPVSAGGPAESEETNHQAASPPGFGRDTQVIPLGLPLSWREYREILASTKAARERRTG
jgi:hypothetical protein